MSQENITEISKALADGKLIIGTDRVLKGLKNTELSKVFVTSNISEIVKGDIEHYAKLSDTEVLYLDLNSEDLGEVCKKRFNISLVAIVK